MPSRLLVVALLAPSLCSAQVTGTFSLEKTTFAPGEPIFLSLTLHNSGKEAKEVVTADPYSFCSGYKIQITPDAAPQPACFRSFAVSCLSSAISLAPGATRAERILLNYPNTPPGVSDTAVKTAGYYTVEATRIINYGPPGSLGFMHSNDRSETHETYHLHVDDAIALSPTVYAPFVEQLNSKDSAVRHEAARTLAAIAPPALEPLLLTFATSKDADFKQFAPLALFNLSTKASIAALAQMLVDAASRSYESMTAAKYLGMTHDPAWLPVLLEVADQQGSMYLRFAAESGGDVAVAPLLTSLRAPASRNGAISALGYTGSRAAVPILISILATPTNDEEALNTIASANNALRQLTHLYPEPPSHKLDAATLVSWHNRWQNWWLTSGQTATIYKPEDCVVYTKLP